ncbi:MAG: adenosine deaminase [Rhodospirillales bacterium]|nr:adenosine deaminase [Rhodospirillales bacterium]
MEQSLTDLIRRLPKAELHLHIEGSLEPEMLFELSRRNDVAIPFETVDAVRAAYQFSNLQDFLDIYYQGMSVLRTAGDFFDLTMAYLRRCADENIVHVEIFFDPQGHLERGIAFETALDGICGALEEGETRFGISYRLIMCFLRHLSEEDGFRVLDMARDHKDRILGVGLDSSELGHPPEKFERLFAACRAEGFKLVAHAGEEGPPEYIRQAIELLDIDRIDHGNRCMEDPVLTRDIAGRRLALTTCPLSNLKLRVITDLKNHPAKRMLDAGLCATVNSDDPAYFGGYLTENFVQLAEALRLNREDVKQLAANGFTASFLDDAEKEKHIRKIQEML